MTPDEAWYCETILNPLYEFELIVGAAAPVTPPPPSAAPNPLMRFQCSTCGHWYESRDSREINWCDHRVMGVYGQAPTLYRRVR